MRQLFNKVFVFGLFCLKMSRRFLAFVVVLEAVPLHLQTQADSTLLTLPGSAPFAEGTLFSLLAGSLWFAFSHTLRMHTSLKEGNWSTILHSAINIVDKHHPIYMTFTSCFSPHHTIDMTHVTLTWHIIDLWSLGPHSGHRQCYCSNSDNVQCMH